MLDKFISKDKIIKLANTNSTNEFAADLLNNKDVAEGTIIWAISQTKGKGQKGNSWESEDGKNLTFSLILHPAKLDPSRQFLLNKAISLGVIDFLKTKIDKNLVKIKWPNDIYVGKCKIGGILIENEILGTNLQSSIIGIGLNVNQTVFSKTLPNPTSLYLELGVELNIDAALFQLLSKIEDRIIKLYNIDIKSIKIDYLNSLLYYRVYNNYLLSGEKIEAMILDISEYGQLIIQKNNNEIIKCNFKEIIFLHD